MKNHGELHEDTTSDQRPTRPPRHEEADTKRIWHNALLLVGFLAVTQALGASFTTLIGIAPASDLGIAVAAPIAVLQVALAVWSVVMAVQGYRWRELRGILYGAAGVSVNLLILWLSDVLLS